jgi:hypothetical protein
LSCCGEMQKLNYTHTTNLKHSEFRIARLWFLMLTFI